MTNSRYIYRAAGEPPMPGTVTGECRTCGKTGTGLPFAAWVKDSFTNHDLLRAGTVVCHACLFCFEDKSLELKQKTGRDKPQKIRTYSHFVTNGEWQPLTKGEKRTMRALLARDPQVAVISERGQKHLIFRSRVGWWQFEEQAIFPDWPRVEGLIEVIEELLSGFSKQEIGTGNYSLYRIEKFGMTQWRNLNERLTGVRRSAYFQLALFLAQKEQE